MDFEAWLASLGLERHLDALRREDVDLESAAELTDLDLERLGLSLGHRRRFLSAAARLRHRAAAAAAAEPVDAAAPPLERRPVTVAFVDLVDATALAARLDPEEMQALLDRYRGACAAVVARFEGHVAQYLGDGILAYFGYPSALEHAAERAVRAALEIVRSVGALPGMGATPLRSRVGIASGIVAAPGGAATAERTVVGDAPNLAARLQALAEPDSVVVGAATRALTGALFAFAPLGPQRLKGYAEPQEAWRVVRELAVESRYAGTRAAAPGPLIGRQRELAYLRDSWQRARAGNGHLVLVGGEAGIGKSRLLEAMVAAVEPERLLRCQCSPYHRNSALHPFAQMLRQTFGLSGDDDAAQQAKGIDALLARLARTDKAARVLVAELLELACDETLTAIEMTPAQRMKETIVLVEDFLAAEAAGTALLLLVEDAHWIDPTSSTVLDRLLRRIASVPILALVSHRPEWTPAWLRHADVSAITCNPLGAVESEAMVRAIAAGVGIDDAKLREIVARSDGVPLFVEELTKTVVELRAGAAASVPATLRDSLTARLDRLGDARVVAQVASVLGREFELATLRALAGQAPATLDTSLARLRDAGLVLDVVDSTPPACAFNHALIQEAAYESLSLARRADLHGRVAALLAARDSAAVELIAHHHSRAGAAAAASACWLQAAERARSRCAFSEAVAHLQAALAESERVGDPDTSAQLKLQSQLQLGATLLMQQGPHSAAVADALAAARDLAEARGAGPEVFQATWGLYLHAAANLRFEVARAHGKELIAISERLGDDDLHMEAMHHLWGMAYFSGDTAGMLHHTSQALPRYDRTRHHRFAHVFGGHDLGVCAHCVRGLACALRAQARAIGHEVQGGVGLAESLEHPTSLAFALGNASVSSWMVSDFDATAAFAERLLAVGTRYDLAAQRALGLFMLGLLRTRLGEPALGARDVEAHYDLTRSQGFLSFFPQISLAEALTRAGRRSEAPDLLNGTLGAAPSAEGVFVAELWRQRGELLGADGATRAAGEIDLRTALRIATKQGSTLHRLRAVHSLAQLLDGSGRREAARTLLVEHGGPDDGDASVPERSALAQLGSAIGPP